MKTINKLSFAVMSVLLFASCLPTQAQTSHLVTVTNFQFSPANLSIDVGDTVIWTNTNGFHNVNGTTVTFPGNPASFSSGEPASATWTYSKVFDTEGFYNYQCDIHPTSMQGTIEVNPVTPSCEAPFPAATGLSAAVQGNGVLFSWNPVAGQIGCQFSLSPINGGTAQVIVSGAAASSQFVPGSYLSLGTEYTYGVRCGCSQSPLVAGPWVYSTFTTPGSPIVTSSPNPTADVSNVTFSVVEEGTATLAVYDMTGRMVKTLYTGDAGPENEYRFTFDGSDLPAGVYIYRLTTETETVIEKFMISK